MLKWLPVIGLALTMIGILNAFYLPTGGARWAGPLAEEAEGRLRGKRTAVGAGMVIVGTALQMIAAWPG